jgi:hypothetical protein
MLRTRLPQFSRQSQADVWVGGVKILAATAIVLLTENAVIDRAQIAYRIALIWMFFAKMLCLKVSNE